MLKALIIKNRMESFASGGPIILAIFLLFSIGDALFHYPDKFFWPVAIPIGVTLAMVAGVSGFAGDYKNDWKKFLEYLPLSRSSIWLANILDGLVFPILLLVFLFGYRWLTYVPPQDEMLLHFFPSRGALFIDFCALFFFLDSAFLPFVPFLRKGTHSQALIVAPLMALLAIGFVGLGNLATQVSILPALHDLAPVLLTMAGLQYLAAYLIFARTPWHWPLWRMGLFILLPLQIVVVAGGLGALYAGCMKWQHITPQEQVRFYGAQRVEQNGEPYVLCDVVSYRSAHHQIVLRPSDGRGFYLQRYGLGGERDLISYPGKWATISKWRNEKSFLPGDARLVVRNLDGSNPKTALYIEPVVERQDGLVRLDLRDLHYIPSADRWIYRVDARPVKKTPLGYTTDRMRFRNFQNDTYLTVADGSGKEMFRTKQKSDLQISDSGRALLWKRATAVWVLF